MRVVTGVEDLNDANVLEVASALMYIEDHGGWLSGCGQEKVCLAPAIASHFRIFQDVFLNWPSGHVASGTGKIDSSSSTSTLSIVA